MAKKLASEIKAGDVILLKVATQWGSPAAMELGPLKRHPNHSNAAMQKTAKTASPLTIV